MARPCCRQWSSFLLQLPLWCIKMLSALRWHIWPASSRSVAMLRHTPTTTIGLRAPDNPAYHPHTENHNGHSHTRHIGYVYESLCICHRFINFYFLHVNDKSNMSQVTNCVTAYSFFNITGCTLASAVLMATGSISGKGQFLTPHRIHTP